MVVYNVTVKTNPEITKEWIGWMHEEHIPEMMGTGLFTSFRFCRLLEQDETEGVTFSVQYTCESLVEYETYINSHSPAIRAKSLNRFGDQVIAFRTVMETIAQY